MKTIQKGFTTLEMLLVIVILAIVVGTGYYVYHSKQSTDKTLNAAQGESTAVKVTKKTTVSTTTTTTTTKYFTISQWGVRAPYSGTLTLLYGLGDPSDLPAVAWFSSAQLDSSDPNCKVDLSTDGYGGSIDRSLKSDSFNYAGGDASGMTVEQYAATLKPADYGHVGDYYYFFRHSQAACSDKTASNAIESQTNSDVQSIVPKLQAIPQ